MLKLMTPSCNKGDQKWSELCTLWIIPGISRTPAAAKLIRVTRSSGDPIIAGPRGKNSKEKRPPWPIQLAIKTMSR